MSREFTLSGDNITLSNQATTLAFLMPGATASIEILRAWVSQSGSTVSAQQRVQLVTQTGGMPTITAKTPSKLKLADPASLISGGTTGAAGVSGIAASAEGAGSKSVIWSDAFNVLSGWLWVPTPAETILLNAGATSSFGLYLPTAPASLTGWSFGIVFREI